MDHHSALAIFMAFFYVLHFLGLYALFLAFFHWKGFLHHISPSDILERQERGRSKR